MDSKSCAQLSSPFHGCGPGHCCQEFWILLSGGLPSQHLMKSKTNSPSASDTGFHPFPSPSIRFLREFQLLEVVVPTVLQPNGGIQVSLCNTFIPARTVTLTALIPSPQSHGGWGQKNQGILQSISFAMQLPSHLNLCPSNSSGNLRPCPHELVI